MDIREAIDTVFPKLDAPKYRLSNAIIEDDYGDDSYTFKEEWETWDQIEDWQLVKSDVFFSYAPLPVAIYVLPRFLFFVLDEIDGLLEEEHQGCGAGDTAVWFVQRLKNKGYQNTGLSKAQIDVLEKFLAHAYQDYDYSVTIDVGKKQL